MRKQIRMITYLPYYNLDAAFDNGLRKDYGNSEIRYDHFYYKEKKLSFTKKEDVYKRSLLSFTRQEFCNTHQFIDLRLTLEKDGSGCLSLRDNGVKFNPLEYRNRDTQYGLAIIRGISEKIDYHYVASMNCLNVMIR